jgi:hypothetical protein
MMRIAGTPPADQAALLRHEPHMIPIADAPRLRVQQNAFVDRLVVG